MDSFNNRSAKEQRKGKAKKKFRMCGEPLPDAVYFDDDMGVAVARFSPLSINQVMSMDAANAQNYEEAFEYQSRYVDDVVEFYRAHQQIYWDFSLMRDACNGLRVAARRADRATNGQGNYANKAAICMETFYKFCIEDPGTKIGRHKSQGMLIPINHILRIYTSLEMYDICHTVIRTVLPQVLKGKFCMPLMVSFRFHAGRLAALERNYDDALQHLTYAYTNCNLRYQKKVRMILIYLLPLEIILSCYILTKHIMDKYKLSFYWQLSSAVRKGDLQAFRAITEKHFKYFAKDSLFIILGDLKDMVYTNVLKKVRMAEGSNIIPISSYIARLQAMSPKEKFDLSEMVYLLGSLIIKNKIKGYVSYDRQVVVLCRDDPFPRVTDVEYPGRYTYYYY